MTFGSHSLTSNAQPTLQRRCYLQYCPAVRSMSNACLISLVIHDMFCVWAKTVMMCEITPLRFALQHYVQVKVPSEEPFGLNAFHAQNEGVNFRQAYRWGLRGPYLAFTKVYVHPPFWY